MDMGRSGNMSGSLLASLLAKYNPLANAGGRYDVSRHYMGLFNGSNIVLRDKHMVDQEAYGVL